MKNIEICKHLFTTRVLIGYRNRIPNSAISDKTLPFWHTVTLVWPCVTFFTFTAGFTDIRANLVHTMTFIRVAAISFSTFASTFIPYFVHIAFWFHRPRVTFVLGNTKIGERVTGKSWSTETTSFTDFRTKIVNTVSFIQSVINGWYKTQTWLLSLMTPNLYHCYNSTVQSICFHRNRFQDHSTLYPVDMQADPAVGQVDLE